MRVIKGRLTSRALAASSSIIFLSFFITLNLYLSVTVQQRKCTPTSRTFYPVRLLLQLPHRLECLISPSGDMLLRHEFTQVSFIRKSGFLRIYESAFCVFLCCNSVLVCEGCIFHSSFMLVTVIVSLSL